MEGKITLKKFAFSITEGEHSEMVAVQVGGVDLKMLIDSGANSNIRDLKIPGRGATTGTAL